MHRGNAPDPREQEIREIAIAANSGEASDAQLARLDQFICEDPSLATYVAALVDQQAYLTWRGTNTDWNAVELAAPRTLNLAADVGTPSQTSAFRWSRWVWPAVAVGLAFILGTFASQVFRGGRGTTQAIEVAQAASPTYEARLIRSTACLWDNNSAGATEIGSGLTSGESLHLLEGLAEFTLAWSRGGTATLSLEGPAAMMLTSEGMPSLRFGRLSATVTASNRPFVLETPVGRLVVSEFGSIGASAFGNDAEIHVFDGSATLEPAWLSTVDQSVPLKIEAGHAIRVQEGAGGELTFTKHPSDKAYFVAQLSMSSDALMIPPTYQDAVKEAQPLGYWRFERDAWPIAPNQMGSKYECRVEGALGIAAFHNNQVVEFGVTDQGGEIICNELLDDAIRDSYSIEFWIKPSHYHVGSVFSLVGDAETPNGIVPHSLLLELGGTGLIPTAVHHPGRMRFLHRSPASNESETGTSCYSTDAYMLRKWQHVVAVKDGSRMSLYFNGELAGEHEDLTPLPPNMRLLVGRLYPSRRVRPFIGQFDELAIYNRALKPAEIKHHYRLVRPESNAANKTSI
jgi:hypothetical protein